MFVASASSFLFLSSSANCSASFFAFSISSSDKLLDAVIVVLISLLVARSLAETLIILFGSTSTVTSICGMPLGAGGIPPSINSPRSVLSEAIGLSPWQILI